MTTPSVEQDETYFIRREECRKCDATVWVNYVLDDQGNQAGWGVCPIDRCGNPDRCGEKVIGLGDGDLALVDYRPAGAA
jgi:hypothetical protein